MIKLPKPKKRLIEDQPFLKLLHTRNSVRGDYARARRHLQTHRAVMAWLRIRGLNDEIAVRIEQATSQGRQAA